MAPPVLTANSPVLGSISWTPFNLAYRGRTYAIPAGSTNKKYSWWPYNGGAGGALQYSDTLPSLTVDDDLLFLNKGGVPISVPTAQGIDGSLIVSGSIAAGALSAGSVTTDVLAAGVVTADKLAAGVITGDIINGGTITGTAIQTTSDLTAARVALSGAGITAQPANKTIAGKTSRWPFNGTIASGATQLYFAAGSYGFGTEITRLIGRTVYGPGYTSAGVKVTDYGFNYATNQAYLRVASAPSAAQTNQQYYIDTQEIVATGTTKFTAADVGRVIAGPGIVGGSAKILYLLSNTVARIDQATTAPGVAGTFTITGAGLSYDTSAGTTSIAALAGASLSTSSDPEATRIVISSEGFRYFLPRLSRTVTGTSGTAGQFTVTGPSGMFNYFHIGRVIGPGAGNQFSADTRITDISNDGTTATVDKPILVSFTNGTWNLYGGTQAQIDIANDGTGTAYLGFHPTLQDADTAQPAMITTASYDGGTAAFTELGLSSPSWKNGDISELRLYSSSRDAVSPPYVYAGPNLQTPRMKVGTEPAYFGHNWFEAYILRSTPSGSAQFVSSGSWVDFHGHTVTGRTLQEYAVDDGVIQSGDSMVAQREGRYYMLARNVWEANTTGLRSIRWITQGGSIMAQRDMTGLLEETRWLGVHCAAWLPGGGYTVRAQLKQTSGSTLDAFDDMGVNNARLVFGMLR